MGAHPEAARSAAAADGGQMTTRPDIYTPETLAAHWGCTARHVRNLIHRGQLRAFPLGGKLWRIQAAAVEEFECRTNTASGDCGESSPSSTSTAPASGTVTRLAPLTRARLGALRQRSTPS